MKKCKREYECVFKGSMLPAYTIHKIKYIYYSIVKMQHTIGLQHERTQCIDQRQQLFSDNSQYSIITIQRAQEADSVPHTTFYKYQNNFPYLVQVCQQKIPQHPHKIKIILQNKDAHYNPTFSFPHLRLRIWSDELCSELKQLCQKFTPKLIHLGYPIF